MLIWRIIIGLRIISKAKNYKLHRILFDSSSFAFGRGAVFMIDFLTIEKSPFDKMVEAVRSYIGRNGGFKRIVAWGQYADA